MAHTGQREGLAACALGDRKCVPCEGGVPKLTEAQSQALLAQVGPGWQVVNNHHVEKEFKFKDYVSALAFVNRLSVVAEAEGHHPMVHLTWGYVKVIMWTHAIDGLSENDFILAAKIEKAL